MRVCNLHQNSQQRRIFISLSKVSDQTHILWILVGFVTAEPQWELKTSILNFSSSHPWLPVLPVSIIQAIFLEQQNMLDSSYVAQAGSFVDLLETLVPDVVPGLVADPINALPPWEGGGGCGWHILPKPEAKNPLHLKENGLQTQLTTPYPFPAQFYTKHWVQHKWFKSPQSRLSIQLTGKAGSLESFSSE